MDVSCNQAKVLPLDDMAFARERPKHIPSNEGHIDRHQLHRRYQIAMDNLVS